MGARSKLDQPTPGGHLANWAIHVRGILHQDRRDLSLVAADTTARRLLVLNHRTALCCRSCGPLRMSMSLPLVWQGSYLARGVG